MDMKNQLYKPIKFPLMSVTMIDLVFQKYFCTKLENKNSRTCLEKPLISENSRNFATSLISKNIEKVPYGIHCTEFKLPDSWSLKDRWEWLDKKKRFDWGDLELDHYSLRVVYRGLGRSDEDAAAIRSNFFIPKDVLVYYFEIEIINEGQDGYIGVGLCSSDVELDRLPGWENCSLGYHGDDGHIFRDSGTGIPYGPSYKTGDIIGVCFNRKDNSVFFTKNGLPNLTAFKNIMSKRIKNLKPVVGLRTLGEEILANFGKEPFIFDLNQYSYILLSKITWRINEYNRILLVQEKINIKKNKNRSNNLNTHFPEGEILPGVETFFLHQIDTVLFHLCLDYSSEIFHQFCCLYITERLKNIRIQCLIVDRNFLNTKMSLQPYSKNLGIKKNSDNLIIHCSLIYSLWIIKKFKDWLTSSFYLLYNLKLKTPPFILQKHEKIDIYRQKIIQIFNLNKFIFSLFSTFSDKGFFRTKNCDKVASPRMFIPLYNAKKHLMRFYYKLKLNFLTWTVLKNSSIPFFRFKENSLWEITFYSETILNYCFI